MNPYRSGGQTANKQRGPVSCPLCGEAIDDNVLRWWYNHLYACAEKHAPKLAAAQAQIADLERAFETASRLGGETMADRNREYARAERAERARDRYEGWLSILFRATSDHGKLCRVLIPKALRGEEPNIERVLVEADRIRVGGRVPQTGSGHRPDESGSHPGSSPASSSSDSIGHATRAEQALRDTHALYCAGLECPICAWERGVP